MQFDNYVYDPRFPAHIKKSSYLYFTHVLPATLTHWGRVTHIRVSKLNITGSGNGLPPGRRQAIIWTNAGILFIRTLITNFRELLSKLHAFSFKKMNLKMPSAKWRTFCLGLNVLMIPPEICDEIWISNPFSFNFIVKYKVIIYEMFGNNHKCCA